MADTETAAAALGVTARTVRIWSAGGAPSRTRKRTDGQPGRPGRDYDIAELAEWAFAAGKIDAAQRRRALKAAGLAAIDAARADPVAPQDSGDSDAGGPVGLKEQKLAAQVRRLEADIQRLTLANAARSGEMVEIAEARRLLGVFTGKLREAGIALQREYGAGAYALLEAAYKGMEEALG